MWNSDCGLKGEIDGSGETRRSLVATALPEVVAERARGLGLSFLDDGQVHQIRRKTAERHEVPRAKGFSPNISHAEPPVCVPRTGRQRTQKALRVRRYGRHGGIGRFRSPPGALCAPRPEKAEGFSAGSACLCVAPVCVANATGRRRQASLREQLQHLGSGFSSPRSGLARRGNAKCSIFELRSRFVPTVY